MKKTVRMVADIAALAGGSIPEMVENTVAAMSDGADVIFQACLHVENRIGHIDFLEKADNPSCSGRHAYEVTDTKLSRKTAPKHVIQLYFNSERLELFQGTLSKMAQRGPVQARSLATLIANPRLLETACNTVEQMGLINILCRAYYAVVTDQHKILFNIVEGKSKSRNFSPLILLPFHVHCCILK